MLNKDLWYIIVRVNVKSLQKKKGDNKHRVHQLVKVLGLPFSILSIFPKIYGIYY